MIDVYHAGRGTTTCSPTALPHLLVLYIDDANLVVFHTCYGSGRKQGSIRLVRSTRYCIPNQVRPLRDEAESVAPKNKRDLSATNVARPFQHDDAPNLNVSCIVAPFGTLVHLNSVYHGSVYYVRVVPTKTRLHAAQRIFFPSPDLRSPSLNPLDLAVHFHGVKGHSAPAMVIE